MHECESLIYCHYLSSHAIHRSGLPTTTCFRSVSTSNFRSLTTDFISTAGDFLNRERPLHHPICVHQRPPIALLPLSFLSQQHHIFLIITLTFPIPTALRVNPFLYIIPSITDIRIIPPPAPHSPSHNRPTHPPAPDLPRLHHLPRLPLPRHRTLRPGQTRPLRPVPRPAT